MRGMDFDYLKAGFERAASRIRERFHHAPNSVFVQRSGIRIGLGKRHGAWRHGLPTALRFRNRSIAFRRTQRAAFASRVRQLDSRNARLFAKESGDS